MCVYSVTFTRLYAPWRPWLCLFCSLMSLQWLKQCLAKCRCLTNIFKGMNYSPCNWILNTATILYGKCPFLFPLKARLQINCFHFDSFNFEQSGLNKSRHAVPVYQADSGRVSLHQNPVFPPAWSQGCPWVSANQAALLLTAVRRDITVFFQRSLHTDWCTDSHTMREANSHPSVSHHTHPLEPHGISHFINQLSQNKILWDGCGIIPDPICCGCSFFFLQINLCMH